MGKQKINIPMCAAMILLLLTLLSIHMTSGLYARYTVTSTASDSARVAKFDVRSELAGETQVDVVCMPNCNGAFALNVENFSEVAVEYTVSVAFDRELPEGISVKLEEETGTLSADRKSVAFTGAQLAPGGTKNLTLTFSAEDLTKDAEGASVEIELNFDVIIHAMQID